MTRMATEEGEYVANLQTRMTSSAGSFMSGNTCSGSDGIGSSILFFFPFALDEAIARVSSDSFNTDGLGGVGFSDPSVQEC